MPKVEPADVSQKLVPFSLPSKFEAEISEDDLKKNPHYITYLARLEIADCLAADQARPIQPL